MMTRLHGRKPLAISSWKMAMTISESRAFVREFRSTVDSPIEGSDASLSPMVDIVLCPPYTALYVVAQALSGSSIWLGAQDVSAASGKAHTGEISAALLADVGCEWVLVGHWEIRRRLGETDADVNVKVHKALDAGLRPVLLIGEGATRRGEAERVLTARLPRLLQGCEAGQVARMAAIYEPEWAIGADEPAPPDYVAAGCRFIRGWIAQRFGDEVAEDVRTIYGGSVSPEYAEDLLASPDVDGLGASRKGRDPQAFAEIVRLIARVKGLMETNG